MSKSRIESAKAEIFRYFDALPMKVHRRSHIASYLEEGRGKWRLPSEINASGFLRLLMGAGRLSEIIFPFPPPYKREVRYLWGDVSLYEVAQALKPNSYFSHYTAVKFHGLTEQLPKTTYLNVEQPNASVTTGPLTQKAIETAFRRPARTSGNIAETRDFRVCIISGKNTGNLGVIEEAVVPGAGPLRFTNLERTLIDAAVRPGYAGGVFEVRKAYELAKEKLSVERLVKMLKKLAYTYPYHQAIGYYLERAGCEPVRVEALRKLPMEFDFYLTHQMSQTDYVKGWRLFVPKGF
jgi:predicted transcriptional regulator of viral defense system